MAIVTNYQRQQIMQEVLIGMHQKKLDKSVAAIKAYADECAEAAYGKGDRAVRVAMGDKASEYVPKKQSAKVTVDSKAKIYTALSVGSNLCVCSESQTYVSLSKGYYVTITEGYSTYLTLSKARRKKYEKLVRANRAVIEEVYEEASKLRVMLRNLRSSKKLIELLPGAAKHLNVKEPVAQLPVAIADVKKYNKAMPVP